MGLSLCHRAVPIFLTQKLQGRRAARGNGCLGSAAWEQVERLEYGVFKFGECWLHELPFTVQEKIAKTYGSLIKFLRLIVEQEVNALTDFGSGC